MAARKPVARTAPVREETGPAGKAAPRGEVDPAVDLWYTSLLLLGFDVPQMSALHHVSYGAQMFDKPNQKGMEHVLYYLFDKIDSAANKTNFKGIWPVIDKDQARDFKRVALRVCETLMKEGHLPANCARVSLFQQASGISMYKLLWHLSSHALRVVLERDYPNYKCPPVPTHDAKREAQLKTAGAPGIPNFVQRSTQLHIQREARRFATTARQSVAQRTAWVENAALLERRYREATADLRKVEREQHDFDVSVDRTLFTVSAMQAREARAQQVRSGLFESTAAYEVKTARDRSVLDDIVSNRANSLVLDSAALKADVPDIITTAYRREIQAGNVALYQKGKLDLESLVRLWNICLTDIKRKFFPGTSDDEVYFPPNFHGNMEQVRADLTRHGGVLDSILTLNEEARSRVPELMESIEKLRSLLVVPTEAPSTPDSERLGLVPPTPHAVFGPAATPARRPAQTPMPKTPVERDRIAGSVQKAVRKRLLPGEEAAEPAPAAAPAQPTASNAAPRANKGTHGVSFDIPMTPQAQERAGGSKIPRPRKAPAASAPVSTNNVAGGTSSFNRKAPEPQQPTTSTAGPAGPAPVTENPAVDRLADEIVRQMGDPFALLDDEHEAALFRSRAGLHSLADPLAALDAGRAFAVRAQLTRTPQSTVRSRSAGFDTGVPTFSLPPDSPSEFAPPEPAPTASTTTAPVAAPVAAPKTAWGEESDESPPLPPREAVSTHQQPVAAPSPLAPAPTAVSTVMTPTTHNSAIDIIDDLEAHLLPEAPAAGRSVAAAHPARPASPPRQVHAGSQTPGSSNVRAVQKAVVRPLPDVPAEDRPELAAIKPLVPSITVPSPVSTARREPAQQMSDRRRSARSTRGLPSTDMYVDERSSTPQQAAAHGVLRSVPRGIDRAVYAAEVAKRLEEMKFDDLSFDLNAPSPYLPSLRSPVGGIVSPATHTHRTPASQVRAPTAPYVPTPLRNSRSPTPGEDITGRVLFPRDEGAGASPAQPSSSRSPSVGLIGASPEPPRGPRAHTPAANLLAATPGNESGLLINESFGSEDSEVSFNPRARERHEADA